MGEHHRTDPPFIHCFAKMVGDGDEQDVVRLRAQVFDGVEQVFRVHAESVLSRFRLKKLDPLGGTPTIPPPPRFGRWDPQTPMNSNPLERWAVYRNASAEYRRCAIGRSITDMVAAGCGGNEQHAGCCTEPSVCCLL